eukprot:107829_1
MDVKYNAYIAKLNSEISPAFAERINEWAENNEFDDFDSLCAEIKEDEPLIFEALEIPLYHRMWMMRLLIDERALPMMAKKSSSELCNHSIPCVIMKK